MPELPEVEVTRLSFADRIAGARIELVDMGKPLRWPLGCSTESLCGQKVLGVRRRGKYLLLDLERGLLLLHLGMSGSVTFTVNPGTVVGVGNIYASEALFIAGIRPTTRACNVSRPRIALLHAAVRTVLARAVEKGGSTLRDFSNAQGESGHFQLEAAVYGRAGLPCRACGSPIRTIRQGQRSTFFCPVCQKR